MILPGDHVRHRSTGQIGVAETMPRGADDDVTVRWGVYDGREVRSVVRAGLLERVDVQAVS